MKHSISSTRRAAIAVIGMALLAAPLYAHQGQGKQSGGRMGMMGGQGMGPGAQKSSGIMHDMAGQMKRMSEQMMSGDIGPDLQNQMAERMQEMGTMMDKLSGMMGQGMNLDMQEQMERMRKRMDEMIKQ